jgi:hypothetical protein
MNPEKDEKVINDLLNAINTTYCSNPNFVSLNCRIVNYISDHCINILEDLIKKYYAQPETKRNLLNNGFSNYAFNIVSNVLKRSMIIYPEYLDNKTKEFIEYFIEHQLHSFIDIHIYPKGFDKFKYLENKYDMLKTENIKIKNELNQYIKLKDKLQQIEDQRVLDRNDILKELLNM